MQNNKHHSATKPSKQVIPTDSVPPMATANRSQHGSSRLRPPLLITQEHQTHGGRTEGPLSNGAGLLDNTSKEQLHHLLHLMRQSDDLMFIYILSSPSGTLYVGVTNNLSCRIPEHKKKRNNGFTSQYSCTKLVYFEIHFDATEAIDREKQIKNWRREKKERLIKSLNPPWIDLAPFLPETDEREY